MKTLRRWLFRSLLITSLLFCAATIFLWIRSYRVYDSLAWTRTSFSVNFESDRGDMSVQIHPIYNGPNAWPSPIPPGFSYFGWTTQGSVLWNEIPSTDDHQLGRLGFALNHTVSFGYLPNTGVGLKAYQGNYAVYFPHWFVVAISAGLSVMLIRKQIRARRRAAANLCRRCGYDLRATPDRCPECGTIPQVVQRSRISSERA